MNTEFRRIHLLRAALQVKGAPHFEIESLTKRLIELGGTKFDEWNQSLDERGMQLLKCVLAEGGEPYANVVIDGFLEITTKHYQITGDEIQRGLKARLEGLN